MKIAQFCKRYGTHTVLQVPELELVPGKVYAVIGANGSGKSTLARILAGTLEPDSRKRVLPEEITVGYMPQRSFSFRMSVAANIRLGGPDPERAQHLMEALGIDPLANRSAKVLSGGETAKLALARLLMQRRDLLILDEPTASMDIRSALQAETLITEECRARNCAVLLVTHSLSQARRMADEILFFSGGVLAEHGDAHQILHHPNDPRTREFLHFYGGE